MDRWWLPCEQIFRCSKKGGILYIGISHMDGERKAFPSCHVLIYSRMLQTSVNKLRMNIYIFDYKYIIANYKEE